MKTLFTLKTISLAVALAVLGSQQQANALDLFSDPGDGFTEARSTGGPWPAVHPSFDGSGGEGFFMNIGEWFGDGVTTAVIPFQLPNLGAISNPFTSASLGVHLFEMGTATVSNVDLYGVRIASVPDLLPADHYQGTAVDPSATLIQAGFLTPASTVSNPAAPNNFTDAGGDAALLSYLNTSYASGTNAGDYVFFRLSYAFDGFATDWDAYKITSRNAGGGNGDYPILSVGTVILDGDTNNNSVIELEEDFGPIRDNWLETNASFGSVLARADGDLNSDGMIDLIDFREWKDAFLATGGTSSAVATAFASIGVAVPEPTTLSLAALMAAFMCGSNRRRS